ncbi:MAG: hypothetical protein JJ863_33370 [Deltaproteobacteria bacterium]|nr:hypothetical protein [Deltaproteobacteria bacterium]
MWWLIVSGATAAVAAIAVPLDLGRRNGQRWGIRRKARSVDPNPYRGATVHEESERGAPLLVRFAAGANIAWGLITMLIFAPAGCLLFLFAGEAPFFVMVLAVVVFSGFLLAVRLMGTAGAVLINETAKVRNTVSWSLVHHMAVALLFALAGMAKFRHAPEVALLPSIPAAIGILLAVLLHAAAARAERVERD